MGICECLSSQIEFEHDNVYIGGSLYLFYTNSMGLTKALVWSMRDSTPNINNVAYTRILQINTRNKVLTTIPSAILTPVYTPNIPMYTLCYFIYIGTIIKTRPMQVQRSDTKRRVV